jgi:hypothetical protein
LYGRYTTHKRFPSALVDVLNLDEAERRKLADAFTYGQERRIDRGWQHEYT